MIRSYEEYSLPPEQEKLFDRWRVACERIELRADYPDRSRRPASDLVWEWLGFAYGAPQPEWDDDQREWDAGLAAEMEPHIHQLERWADGSDPLPERHPSADLGPLFKYFQEPTNGS